MIPNYMQYWGKAKKDPKQSGPDYHLLAYHSLDVAAVANALLRSRDAFTRSVSSYLSLESDQFRSLIVFVFALHDLGKFASAFQKLYDHSSDTLLKASCPAEYDGKEFRHDRLGLFFWNEIQQGEGREVLGLNHLDQEQQGNVLEALMTLMNCSLGHHGKPIQLGELRTIKKRFVDVDHDSEAATEFFKGCSRLFKPVIPVELCQSEEWRKRLEQVSWQIAGLAVLVDWIGSDKSHFHYKSKPVSLEKYWECAKNTAIEALAATDLHKVPQVQPFLSVQEHFGFNPTPLQCWAEQVPLDASPKLFILEDVTGAGKTEAALTLTHRLMQTGAAEGFYFGLPTMATSNAMFSRVAEHYLQMLSLEGSKPSIVLAHGARDMNEQFREAVLVPPSIDTDYGRNDSTATAQCSQWLADSRKKALLAPVGVGTIDQALLAVLPRRHQSLRLLGLNRKILIFDEVHAADEYMFELLESLLAMHLHQGGSAILLTATLSKKQRQKLVSVWHQAVGIHGVVLQNTHFPLATLATINPEKPLIEAPLASRKDVSREVRVSFLSSVTQCLEKVLSAVSSGQCVVWVRNSVDDAIEAFCQLLNSLPSPEQCLLFHSRFVLNDRKNIEMEVLKTFGKNGDQTLRAGKVLIATQVFQESLDADADVMISDICPIDDLIQRAGRLHRHTRDQQGRYRRGISDSRSEPELWVHAPEWQDEPQKNWLSRDFRNTEYVYRSPGRLWLGMKALIQLGAIRMPSEARVLIEAVYGDDAYDQIPETLLDQENQLIGEQRAKGAKANSNLLKWREYGYSARSADAWFEDMTDISTRHSDIETVEVLLLKISDNEILVPWVEDEKFAVQLSTVKLSKNKYANKLALIPGTFEEPLRQLEKRYPQIKYMQCWCPEFDEHFLYEKKYGVLENPRRAGNV